MDEFIKTELIPVSDSEGKLENLKQQTFKWLMS